MDLTPNEREALNRLRRHGRAVAGEFLTRDIELLCCLVDRAVSPQQPFLQPGKYKWPAGDEEVEVEITAEQALQLSEAFVAAQTEAAAKPVEGLAAAQD
ncbi:MAG TPA: hypothetical protein VMY37_04320 [Thermoguttaceae bacterium]|nr:hypothetical protein [Thermoguttaceae bacterium]